MIRIQRLFGRSVRQRAQNQRKRSCSRRFCSRSEPAAVQVENLEERVVLSPGILAVGSDAGITTRVNVFDSFNGVFQFQFNPYNDVPGFSGGVRTAVGYIRDINANSNFPIIVTAPGPGVVLNNPVRVFAGISGRVEGGQFVNAGQALATLNPYPGFGGGIFVGVADFDLDGVADVITGPDRGGGPHVRIQSLANFAVLFNAFVYSPGFVGGVRVAAGQINPQFDPFPDLITAAGPGGGPHVKVFSGINGAEISSFFAYDPAFAGGVYVSSGDFNGNGRAEIVTGPGQGGGPHVRIIDPLLGIVISEAFVFEPEFTGGVRVAAAYLNNDLISDVVVTRGPGVVSSPVDVIAFGGPLLSVLYQGPAFTPRFFGGSFPSSGKLQAFGEALHLDAEGRLPAGAITQITTADVSPLVQAALDRLEQAGVSEADLDELGSLEIQISNFSGSLLGLATPGLIILDDDGAGFGWFVDPTPYDDEEYGPDGRAIVSGAEGRVDLFTVILHELGHHLGLPDLDPALHPHHLMAATLTLGERRLPDPSAFDVLFAGDTLFDHLMAPSLL
jgi:hypothetical protein